MKALLSTLRKTAARGALNPAGVAALQEVILERGLNAARALALADALEGEGRLVEAVAALQTANRLRRDAAIERRLVRLRRAAFASIDRSLPPPAWPPSVREDDWSALPPERAPHAASDAAGGNSEFCRDSPGPAVIPAARLTPGLLRAAILKHGCVLVRGLVEPVRVRRLVANIDRAFAAYDAHAAGTPIARTTPWYDPLENIPEADYLRSFTRVENGVLTGDSPRALYEFLETVADLGLDRLITAYLGERPALSLQKCTLRRAEPQHTGNAWHQDGAFIGPQIRSVNVWFSLSRCGRTAPGLDIVPVRIEPILPVGTPGALYSWDVSEAVVREAYPRGPFWRPEFEAGDALFFDHLCIHRTALDPATMTERRWAIESWFFAPSVYPDTQTPLVV